MVSNQLERIDESAIPNDKVLKQAAGMLSLGNEYDRVQVGNQKLSCMFWMPWSQIMQETGKYKCYVPGMSEEEKGQ